MFNTSGYSLSDIAAVTNGERYEDGFIGNGAWWIIILFLFVFCGWGGNWGGFGRGTSNTTYQGTTTREVVNEGFLNNNLQEGIRGIQNGLCDGFYALNTGILNGFAGVQQGITNGFNTQNLMNLQNTNDIQRNIYEGTVQGMQNTNALQTQLANCCCENREAIAQVRYDMDSDTCAINTNNANNTRDIIDATNANTRAILDAIQQNKVEALQERIAALQAQNQSLQFAASQQAQNTYLIDQLKPCPSPAYIVANPYCNYNNGFCNTCSGCNC